MKKIRIGCASAFWGDTNTAAAQLVEKGAIDYLVFDYLAEITMSILAAKRMKDPNDGYATDFVEHVMAPLMPAIRAKNIKVVANAGGVNPLACKTALEAAAEKAGVNFRVAVVLGDDLLPRRKDFADAVELDSGKPMPPACSYPAPCNLQIPSCAAAGHHREPPRHESRRRLFQLQLRALFCRPAD